MFFFTGDDYLCGIIFLEIIPMRSNLGTIAALFLFLMVVSGCTRKGQTVSRESVPGLVLAPAAPDDLPPFVTDGPRVVKPAPAPAIEPEPEPRPEPAITVIVEPEPMRPAPVPVPVAVTFDERQTQHVRIVDGDPLAPSGELILDMDRLAGEFVYPYAGNRISDYGMRGGAMHTGVDIKAVPNDTIRAALGGTVRMSKPYSGYGNVVVVRHADGLETVYAHNATNLVRPNEGVRAGQPIALAGRTGRATTEHLHFETRVGGEHFDPNLLIDTQNRGLRAGKIYLRRRNGLLAASATPFNGEPRPASVTVAQSRREAVQAPASTASSANHTVQRGDTLYSIARRYGTTVDGLCSLNGIAREGVLRVGQRLKVK